MNIRRLLTILSVVLSLSPTAQEAKAQLLPDNSLGAESSVVTPLDQLNERIDGGATRGSNLFHSFEDFNVGEGRGVFFANPSGIENILSRVTGSSISNILGKLGVLGEANLFLVNPNGIHFGENASLEIGGSFLATTADGIRLGENGLFSATQLDGNQLLSVEPGALFSNALAAQQAAISNAGQLVVGKDLTLAAGNLDLQGQLQAGANLNLLAEDTIKVRDSQVNPFLASAGEQLLLEGNQAVDIFALNHADSGFFSLGEMVFRSGQAIKGDAHYWSGGNFSIEQLDGSLGNLYSPDDPIIRSLGDVEIGGYQGTSLHILAAGSVSIGNVFITGPETGTLGVDYLQENIRLSDGTEVSIDGSARPTLDVRAGMNAGAVGVPGITGNNFPTDLFVNAAFNDLEPPEIKATATSADITVGTVSYRDTTNNPVSNGLILFTNQHEANTSLPGGNISIIGAGINAPGVGGAGGEVFIDARGDASLGDAARIDVRSEGGASGTVAINANGDVSLGNTARIDVRGAGGGGIKINATNLETSPGSVLVAGIRTNQIVPDAQAGNIEINTTEAVNLTESLIANQVSQGAAGQGGDIVINTGSLSVGNGSQLSTSTFGNGGAGSLRINATQDVSFSGEGSSGGSSAAFSTVEQQASGDGGNIEISAPSLTVSDGAGLTASTRGQGNAGRVSINAETVSFRGVGSNGNSSAAFSTVASGASGDGGGIDINTNSLEVKDGAQLIASTLGMGNAGSVTINAPGGSVEFAGTGGSDGRSSAVFSTVEQGAKSKDGVTPIRGGDIRINTSSFSIRDGAQLAASTRGMGNAGTVKINATQEANLSGVGSNGLSSAVFSTVEEGGEGSGGGIEIETPSLNVTDGAGLTASTRGVGNAGTVTINAGNVRFSGVGSNGSSSAAFSTVAERAIGDGGDININATSLEVNDGGQLIASTLGEGKAGRVNINATQSVRFSGTGSDGRSSAAFSTVEDTARGDGGGIDITTDYFLVDDGAELSASTRGRGDAGSIKIRANLIEINNAQISSNSEEQGQAAGNIEITTSQNLRTNGGSITATTESDQGGGNITLRIGDLLILRRNSLISADSTGTGNSGNIGINTRFLIAVPSENSDIIASAVRGGDITLTADGILGIRFRERLTPESDITATGSITLNTPNIDPTDGLVELLEGLVDAEKLVGQNVCAVEGDKIAGGSAFVITGRGGLPLNPNDPLSNFRGTLEWATPQAETTGQVAVRDNSPELSNQRQLRSQRLEQAQGWLVAEDGTVVLTSQATKVTPDGNALNHPGCHVEWKG